MFLQLALIGVNIIPMNRPVTLHNQTIVINDGKISAIGSTWLPPNAIRIPAKGLYLIPGLTDAHVHLQENLAENRAMLRLFIENGVTTVLNLYGTQTHLKLRQSIQSPHIYTSGRSLGDPLGESPSTTPQQIEQIVIEQKRAGYDFVKLHGDLSRDAYHRLVEVTRRENLPLIGHAPRNLGVEPMLQEHQHAVAHVEEYLYAYFHYRRDSAQPIPDLDEKIQKLATETAKAGTTVISTLSVYRGIADQIDNIDRVLARPEVRFLPRTIGDTWNWWPPNNTYVRRFDKKTIPWFRTQYQLLEKVTKAFHEAGVPLLAGTDTPTATMVPGFSMHDELHALVNAGLTPYQALETATVNAAKFLGCAKDYGTVEVGKRADLILLKRNPLEDIRNLSTIHSLVVQGRWIIARRDSADGSDRP